MPLSALALVLLAACTHATWNLVAKQAAACRHFVWFYSLGATLLWGPVVVWMLVHSPLHLTPIHWGALFATAILHMGYSLILQAGYRASDLSVVYPLARGSGPLLAFLLAVLLLGEPVSGRSMLGVALVVSGILLVSGLLRRRHPVPVKGVLYGLATGCFIAAYTVNDGWSVKTLLIPPVLVDWFGNLFRAVMLAPRAWQARQTLSPELRQYGRAALIVSVLGPLGYILVLYAMQLAPVSHVAPARELATLAGTWLGARLLREKGAPDRLAGALLIVIGVISLALA